MNAVAQRAQFFCRRRWNEQVTRGMEGFSPFCVIEITRVQFFKELLYHQKSCFHMIGRPFWLFRSQKNAGGCRAVLGSVILGNLLSVKETCSLQGLPSSNWSILLPCQPPSNLLEGQPCPFWCVEPLTDCKSCMMLTAKGNLGLYSWHSGTLLLEAIIGLLGSDGSHLVKVMTWLRQGT